MLCPRCGNPLADHTLVCSHCKSFVGKYATQSPRKSQAMQGDDSSPQFTLPSQPQGRGEYGDYALDQGPYVVHEPAKRQEMPYRPSIRTPIQNTHKGYDGRRGTRKNQLKKKTNWMALTLVVTCVGLLSVLAYFLYLTQSEEGHHITARKNILSTTEMMFSIMQNDKDPLLVEQREEIKKLWGKVPVLTYWQEGDEYMGVGDLETAVIAYRIANALDAENYDGLLSMASAYELLDDDENAEKIYLYLTDEVTPFRSEAYTALIRLYQEKKRNPEAAEMMRKAYTNTEKDSFRAERNAFIPEMPETDLAAGRHELKQTIHLSSPQGYDVYYTTEEKVQLPQEGTLVREEGIVLDEGTHVLRAVAISEDLKSDEISVIYTIFYPTPPAPKASLAPNTYKSLRTVGLRPGEGAEKEELHYYYTLDGSSPTRNSPEYDGTPIKLPSGRVTLKAVCVNKYDKISNMLEVGYHFKVKPYPMERYAKTDVFSSFVINETEQAEFYETFGRPKKETKTTYRSFPNEAVLAEYSWGNAVFWFDNAKWLLVYIDMHKNIAQGPRELGIGATEKEIISKYRDNTQPPSKDGTRGLYYEYPVVGQILIDANGNRYVHYSCYTLNNKVQSLDYYIQNGRVNRIIHYVTMQ